MCIAWFTDKLQETEIPPYSAFYSTLKGGYTATPEEYNELCRFFRETPSMRTMKDLLVHYNSLGKFSAVNHNKNNPPLTK